VRPVVGLVHDVVVRGVDVVGSGVELVGRRGHDVHALVAHDRAGEVAEAVAVVLLGLGAALAAAGDGDEGDGDTGDDRRDQGHDAELGGLVTHGRVVLSGGGFGGSSQAALGRSTSRAGSVRSGVEGVPSSSSSSPGASMVSRGSTRSSQRGMYQALSPSRCITAGTSSIRTISASTRIATPRPRPNDLTTRSSVSTK